jgi:APA family basic amino acid/polyamine antiporter
VQVVTTVLKLLPLVAVAGLAFWVIGRDGGATLAPFRASDIHPGGITAAGALTLWALLGLESATVPAGKVVDPVRTIPRATLVGTVFTGAIYLLVCSAVVLLMPTDSLKAPTPRCRTSWACTGAATPARCWPCSRRSAPSEP